MSTSMGERLAALVYAGTGIQTRLHRLQSELSSPGARPSLFKDHELEKVRKALDKGFPKRDAAAKEKGWEKLNDINRARSVLSEMASGYETLKDAMKFRDAALPAIKAAPSALVRDPRGTIPAEEQYWPGAASRAFLDVVALYAKIACQMEKLGPESRAYAAGYNAAYFSVHGSDENEFQALSTYLKMFEEGHSNYGKETTSIFRTIAMELMENGDETIVDMVSYLMETIKPWFVPISSGNPQVWQLLTFAAGTFSEPQAAPTDPTKCAPVCYREKARGWVIWCFLICPAALACSRAKFSEYARHEPLLKTVLNETVVEPIFREQTIRVHEEFIEVFGWFPAKAPSGSIKERFEEFFLSGKNPRKLVRDCSIECTNRAALVHRERRVALAQLLLSASYQLQSNPALLGPKAASVVALLAASRDEINWYMNHRGQAPPKIYHSGMMGTLFGNQDVKYIKEDWQDGHRVGVLISCHTVLYDQARSLWWIAERFLYETIRGPHTAECMKRALTEHYQLTRMLAPPPDQSATMILYEARLLELRYETTQRPATASLYSSSSSYGDFFLPVLFFHMTLLGDGFVGTEDGGLTDPQALRLFASLGALVFHTATFQESFEDTLHVQPRYCLGFVDVLSMAQDVLHGYCPEEFIWLGERVSTQTDQFLKKIQDRLLDSLDEYELEKSKLDGQTDPIRAAERMLKRRKQEKTGNPPAPTAASSLEATATLDSVDLKPGFESRPKYRDAVVGLAHAQRAVRSISASLGRKNTNAVIVWNRMYTLREYLRETITAWLDKKLRSMCVSAMEIKRPTIILEQCFRFFECVRFACEHGGFDPAMIITQAWTRETSGEAGTIVDTIGAWLLKFIDSRLFAPGSFIVYSSFARGFFRASELQFLPGPGNVLPPQANVASPFLAEMWLDQVEVDTLASVLGRRGVRSLLRHLQTYATETCNKLKKWIADEEQNLGMFRRTVAQQESGAIKSAKSVRNTDSIVVALRALGATVKCAKMLKDALTRTGAPHGSLRNFPYESDILAEAVESSNAALWALAPLAVSASLVGPGDFWKWSDFLNRLDAHTNNAHLVAMGISAILKKSQDPAVLRARELEFAVSFATVLLEMKREQSGEFRDWPLRSITIFLEKIILESSELRMNDLEALVPFSLRHAAVLDRSLGRARGNDPGMGAEDFASTVLDKAKQLADDEAMVGPGEEGQKRS